MKSYIILLISFILFSCQDAKKSTQDENRNSKQFFNFDEIEYYHKEISLKEWLKIAKKEKKNPDEVALLKILNDYYPTSINDSIFIVELEKLYSGKRKIQKSKFKKISNIFSEKYYGDYSLAGCEPFYRDILIFKKSNKVIGISKICFECKLHSTIGTNKNTEQLGQNGDYRSLKLLLEK